MGNTYFSRISKQTSLLPLHRVSFALFLFSLPFSIRKVLGVFSVDGTFNEYLDVSVYLSDLLLLTTLLLYILETKNSILSIAWWRKMFHVEQLLLPIAIPAFFIVWSGASIFWSENTILAINAFTHLFFGYLLYVYIIVSNVPRGTIATEPDKCSTWNITRIIFTTFIISAIFQSIIAILQFLSQKSIELFFLKESAFSVYDPGIAKVVILGETFIRVYGTFPHPNILGGFLVISILITMVYPLVFNNKLFHVEQLVQNQTNVPRGTIATEQDKCSTWNKINIMITQVYSKMFHVEHLRSIWLYRIVLFLQLIALFLTFSKSAIFSFILATIVVIVLFQKMFHVEQLPQNQTNVPRGTITTEPDKCSTWNKIKIMTTQVYSKMFHVEHLFFLFVILLLAGVFMFFDLKFLLLQPFFERVLYMPSVERIIGLYWFEGLGIGQFVVNIQKFFDVKLLSWQLQPIHNVFLLVLSETGIIGLALFLWFICFVIWRLCGNVPRGTYEIAKCSTWNILKENQGVFHVEHLSGPRIIGISHSIRQWLLRCIFLCIVFIIIFIMFFDHYFFDIQQGQLLFWICVALAIISSNIDKYIKK